MRGFGTILFDMVPKVPFKLDWSIDSFGTILFDMVPKDLTSKAHDKSCFGTILFVMVPKEAFQDFNERIFGRIRL